MAIASSILLVVSLFLAVFLGPQTRSWTWGPALIPLALAAAFSLPQFWKSRRFTDTGFLALSTVTVAWFAWRAWVSPVRELAIADLLLLAAAVSAFLVIRVVLDHPVARGIFLWALTLLVLANVAVISRQITENAFTPIFASRPVNSPSGFFAHYNDCANFLIFGSMVLAAAAWFGKAEIFNRVVWGTGAAAGCAGTFFTWSRGGILAIAIAGLIFILLVLITGKREKARWFVPLACILPILVVISGYFVIGGWMKAQQARSYDVGIEGLMDNSIRLFLLGISISCIQLHPWAGGGSRSFSWDCYPFWNIQNNGWTTARPEYVHNELLQTVTDYGTIGGLLIVVLLMTVVIKAILEVISPSGSEARRDEDFLRAGGLAALGGMFAQSIFSFVFHLLPGAILLGICLGMASIPTGGRQETPSRLTKSLLSAIVVGIVLILLPYGWKGLRVYEVLGKTQFKSSEQPTWAQRLALLQQSIEIWPQAALYKERAMMLQKMGSGEQASEIIPAHAEEAIQNYQKGLELHPYDPTMSINLARMLSFAGRDEQAAREFNRAISLEGEMELGFKAHFHATNHFLRLGEKQLGRQQADQALKSFATAAEQLDLAVKGDASLPLMPNGVQLKKSIYDGLGLARENSGDLSGALQTYLQSGETPGKYRAAALLRNMGTTAWSERRPSEALGYFLQARENANGATELPRNVTAEQKAALIAYLDAQIEFMRGAKIEPSAPENR